MIEYPSIQNSSKAPREYCLAFDKIDGSNFRAKFTQKRGFDLFGSRHQLIDLTHPHLGQAISIFKERYDKVLVNYLKKEFPNEREIIVFGEFFGPNSFAGIHEASDPKDLLFFDVYLAKAMAFLKPKEFMRQVGGIVPTPRLVYEGNLNDQLIADVRAGKYPVNEGVICKGITTNGAYRGKVWMAKIKTQSYFDKLKLRGLDVEKYGE